MNLWHNEFNIISEIYFKLILKILWFWVFDFELFCTFKRLYTAKQLK